jgi:hypothetical protein
VASMACRTPATLWLLRLLWRSRELTRVCSPKMIHQVIADPVGVDVLRGYGATAWPDLARAKGFEKALLDVASYFSARRRALHASGVDECAQHGRDLGGESPPAS